MSQFALHCCCMKVEMTKDFDQKFAPFLLELLKGNAETSFDHDNDNLSCTSGSSNGTNGTNGNSWTSTMHKDFHSVHVQHPQLMTCNHVANCKQDCQGSIDVWDHTGTSTKTHKLNRNKASQEACMFTPGGSSPRWNPHAKSNQIQAPLAAQQLLQKISASCFSSIMLSFNSD